MKQTRFTLPVADIWRSLLIVIVIFTVLSLFLTYKLGSLTQGISHDEAVMRNSSLSISEILNNPLYLHQKAGLYLSQKLDSGSYASLRMPSVAIALIFVLSMYSLLKFWYTTRVALLGSLLLASSSWFLNASRLATSDINFVLPFVLAVGGIWLLKRSLTFISALFLVFVAIALFYVPGMIWLLVAGFFWQRPTIKKLLRQTPISWQTIFAVVFIVGLVPLVWSFSQDKTLILPWLGMPAVWPASFTQYINNVVNIPLQLFIKSTPDPLHVLGRLPLLDGFTSVMLGLGLFASLFKHKLDRTKMIVTSGIIGSLLIGLGGPVSIVFLLPHVYILAASGMALMLQQWLTVFPRNPLARWFGILMITASVVITSYYHLNRYFVAWPKAPETKAKFEQR